MEILNFYIIAVLLIILSPATSSAREDTSNQHQNSSEMLSMVSALISKNTADVKKLLTHGVKPETPYYQQNTTIKTVNGKEVRTRSRDIQYLLILAMKNYAGTGEEVSIIKLLLEHGATPNVKNHWNESPLSLTVKSKYKFKNRLTVLKTLLEAGAKPNMIYNRKRQNTAFEHLVLYGNYPEKHQMMEMMLDHGADANYIDSYGNQILANLISSAAAKSGTSELIKIIDLLTRYGASVNHQKFGTPMFFTTVYHGDYELQDYLLKKGVNINDKDKHGRSALVSIDYRNKNIKSVEKQIRYLLDKGIELNAFDNNGQSILMKVAEDCKHGLAMAKLLLKMGAQLNAGNKLGLTATGMAKLSNCRLNHNYLAKQSGIPYKGGPPIKNDTEVIMAIMNKDIKMLSSFSSQQLQTLTSRSQYGFAVTPLHIAIETGDLAIIKVLSQKDVNWNVPDIYHNTPLHTAVLEGHVDMALYLMTKKANPNIYNKGGETPYSYAYINNRALFNKMLNEGEAPTGLIHKAILHNDIGLVKQQLKNTEPDAALLQTAVFSGNVEIARFLIQKVTHPEKTSEQIIDLTIKSHEAIKAFNRKAGEFKKPAKKRTGIAIKRGDFSHMLPRWSPYDQRIPRRNLKNFSIYVHVPKHYDATKPFGLMIFMHGRLGAKEGVAGNKKRRPGYPNKDYRKIIENKNIIWIGYSAYNGIYNNKPTLAESQNGDFYHEAFNLAIVYEMMQHFNIDENRVYLSGLSWGGRLTCENFSHRPDIFKGGISIGGCANYTDMLPGLHYIRKQGSIVTTSGEFDYNAAETYNGFNYFYGLGVKSRIIQQPRLGHSYLSGPYFKKALELLESGK